MDWIKVLNRHTMFEYTDLTDSEFVAWIKIMSLTAYMERIPERENMLKYTHYKTLISLQDKLNRHSTTLQQVLNKVLIDAQEVVKRREDWKEKKKRKRESMKNVQGDVQGDVSHKIKRREREEIDKDIKKKEEGEESPPFPSDEIKEPKKKTIPPSINDVTIYCRERKNNIDPEEWMAFYNSKDWMIGKNKMTDWKAAVITWEKRGGDGRGRQQQQPNGARGSRVPEISTPREWQGDGFPEISEAERQRNIERIKGLTKGIGGRSI